LASEKNPIENDYVRNWLLREELGFARDALKKLRRRYRESNPYIL
jgi:hypothetical protein